MKVLSLCSHSFGHVFSSIHKQKRNLYCICYQVLWLHTSCWSITTNQKPQQELFSLWMTDLKHLNPRELSLKKYPAALSWICMEKSVTSRENSITRSSLLKHTWQKPTRDIRLFCVNVLSPCSPHDVPPVSSIRLAY